MSSLNCDPRYLDLLETYSHDWSLAMLAFFGKYPDAQQDQVTDKENARTSVSLGHCTGK